MLTEANLYPYQMRMIDAMIARPKIGCFLDLGMGKTICTLTAIARLIKAGEARSALVVTPKSVTWGWRQEAERWEHTRDLRISIISGDARKRLENARKTADLYIVSRDNFAWLSEQKTEAERSTILVLDESTSFKNRGTKRWKSLCLKGRRKHRWLDDFRRIIELTGTPASESLLGLWAQMYILDRGERLYPTLTAFRERYMVPDIIKGRPIYNRFKSWAEAEIKEKIKDICIAMEAKDYLELPERIDIIRYTDYTKDRLYKQMQTDGVTEIDGQHIMAVDGATRYNKLRQIAGGYIYDELGEAHHIHDKKEEALEELLEETANENVLIFYQYEYERQYLTDRFHGEPLDTPEQQARWNDGKIKTAIAHPASLGYGCNIQFGGRTVIWLTLPLSYEQYKQSNGRLYRQGQRNTVKIIHIISAGTIEEKIYKLLKEEKADLLNRLMEAMKKEEI